MSDHRINLEDRAQSTVSDALYGMKTYDTRELCDAVDRAIGQDAENACIYTHHCMTIIQDYEAEYDNGDDTGRDYKAGEWRDAMEAHAYDIAFAALSCMTAAILKEIDEAAEAMVDLVNDAAGDQAGDLTIGKDCPHGWARHDREDAEGTHFWEPAELEGCKAIARECNGVWLSFTWTPEPAVIPAT